jgi:hypothetical protein
MGESWNRKSKYVAAITSPVPFSLQYIIIVSLNKPCSSNIFKWVIDADDRIPVLPYWVKLKHHWNISNDKIVCIVAVPWLRLVFKYVFLQCNYSKLSVIRVCVCMCYLPYKLTLRISESLHTNKINIKHLNSTPINTKLSVRDTQVNTRITIYTTISNKIYKTEVRRTPKWHLSTWFTREYNRSCRQVFYFWS